MRKRILFLIAMTVASLAGTVQAATMNGWDIGWNHMATITGGTAVPYPDLPNMDYAVVTPANVSFSTVDFLNGFFGPPLTYSWADASGDVGQHFFEGAIRMAGYGGSVPTSTAVDYALSGPTTAGQYEWLLNNYSGSTLQNSWIRGTGSSTTIGSSGFVVNLTSDGTWYWYTPATNDSPMSGWIQDRDWSWDTTGAFANYYDRHMTGNFRIVGTFLPSGEISANLEYEVAVVPIPGAAGLGLLGMGLVGYMRRRKHIAA